MCLLCAQCHAQRWGHPTRLVPIKDKLTSASSSHRICFDHHWKRGASLFRRSYPEKGVTVSSAAGHHVDAWCDHSSCARGEGATATFGWEHCSDIFALIAMRIRSSSKYNDATLLFGPELVVPERPRAELPPELAMTARAL